MDAEYFPFHHSSNAQVVKDFSAVLPGIGIPVLADSLVIEAIHGGDLPSLVVASEQGDVGWVLKFEAEKELESFNRVVSSINKVTHEYVSGVGDFSSLIK